jgi:transcriptional regulator with XRE-family HTH domain
MRSFGEIIKEQRKKLGFTQRQLAEMVGVSDAYICSLEGDKRSPPPYYNVVSIAEALKLDAEWLWKIAVRWREKKAVKKSRRKAIKTRDDSTQEDSLYQDNTTNITDSEIEAFFQRPEIQMTAFGLFKKQPKDMTMEEKRFVYQAINSAREFLLGDEDESGDSL